MSFKVSKHLDNIGKMKRCYGSVWFATSLLLVVVLLISPPLILGKKLANGYPVSSEKEITRCSPCFFSSINRPLYEIIVADNGPFLPRRAILLLLTQEVLEHINISPGPVSATPPLRC